MSLAQRVADLATRIGQELKARPGQLSGTTAERLAYPHARSGVTWFDTTVGREYAHNGSGWVSKQLLVQRVRVSVDPDQATVRTVEVALPVPIDAARGWAGTVHSDVGSAGMNVFRVGKQATGTVSSVFVSFLSLTGNFPPTDIDVVVTGYPV